MLAMWMLTAPWAVGTVGVVILLGLAGVFVEYVFLAVETLLGIHRKPKRK
jgi:hypothetical protein